MPTLRAELPNDLYWLTEKVESLIKPTAFFIKNKARLSPRGTTRNWGPPDIPIDAPWAAPAEAATSAQTAITEDMSFLFQMNMEEIPTAVRKPEWPLVGMVWVFGEGWDSHVKFDPRRAADIKWLPQVGLVDTFASSIVVSETVPDCTPGTLPESTNVDSMEDDYAGWAHKTYGEHNERFGNFQVGGWAHPCQGDYDERNKDFVCELSNLALGDDGCASLHYNSERGFYAFIETY
jgi:hypothetical protein